IAKYRYHVPVLRFVRVLRQKAGVRHDDVCTQRLRKACRLLDDRGAFLTKVRRNQPGSRRSLDEIPDDLAGPARPDRINANVMFLQFGDKEVTDFIRGIGWVVDGNMRHAKAKLTDTAYQGG